MQIRFVLLVKLALLLSIVSCTSCQKGDPFDRVEISGPVMVDPQEREFVFEKIFKPKKMINKVCFEYTDALKPDERGAKFTEFADAVALQLKAFVIDQDGNKYELNHIENAFDNYICLLPESKTWLEISKTNTVFIKLLVHSNRKINLSKIQWVSYDIWDI